MSIIYKHNNCTLLSHKTFIDEAYYYDQNCRKSYQLNPILFDINSCFIRSNQYVPSTKNSTIKDNKRKRRQNNDLNTRLQSLIQTISNKTEEFISNCHFADYLPKPPNEIGSQTHNNDAAQALSQSIYSEFKSISPSATINGQNLCNNTIITKLNDTTYIIPQKCKFTCADISELEMYATDLYDFIVIDPPWSNKYVKRAKRKSCGYQMCDENAIIAIPIENLIKSNSLVVIWCTNSPAHTESLRNKFLTKWNLKLLATWYWIKITKYGETVCEFDLPLRKQPFEQLYISTHISSAENQFKDIPDGHCIFSVPSAIHSQKPPLTDLFKPYLPTEPKCLELFARYLLPGYTSYGLEVLKLQNIKLFTEK